ncbi:hypothetical protein [Duncaniella muris]|uniref:hypothetical protein n=1 Tax=Duncaniella muris TaxID=2094150 RepID=UPI003F66F03F
MKRTVLLLAAVVALGGSAFAQNINKNEAKMLKTFLSQTSAKGTSNAVQLGAQVNNPAAIQGVKIQDGHVTEIEWKDKDLAGALDLSGFPALQKNRRIGQQAYHSQCKQ